MQEGSEGPACPEVSVDKESSASGQEMLVIVTAGSNVGSVIGIGCHSFTEQNRG